MYRCGILELRASTPSFRTHRCEAERLFASARNKGIACAKRIEIPLCLHLPWVFFSAFAFYSRRANRSNRRALSACRSICRIRTYEKRKNCEWGKRGSMRNGRPSLMPSHSPLPPTGQPFAAVTGESRWMAGITLSATRLNRKLKNGRRAMKESRSCSGCYRRRSSPFVLLAISRLA